MAREALVDSLSKIPTHLKNDQVHQGCVLNVNVLLKSFDIDSIFFLKSLSCKF
jgi:hypothetical protein